MDDLIARLTAAIDKREKLANEATPGPWTVEELWTDKASVQPNIATYVDCHMEYGEALGDLMQLADARHIAANGPDVVLRGCAADRKLIAEHGQLYIGGCNTCVVPQWGYPTHGGSRPADWPCETLLAVVERYGLEVQDPVRSQNGVTKTHTVEERNEFPPVDRREADL